MQQRLVVWGDIGTDRKALIAIELEDGGTTVSFRAIPEEQVALEVQDQLFTHWKNGGEYTFPEDVPAWKVPAELENIVPEEIHLHKPELLVSAQRQWNKIRNSEANFRLVNDKMHLLEQQLESVKDFDQELWNNTKALWDEISGLKSSGDIGWPQADELKLRINTIFDALKAFRRIHKENNFGESQALFRLFEKQVDECIAQLVYPDEWGKITDRLKNIQKDMKKAPLMFKHIRELRKKIDGAFQSLRSYRQSDHLKHLQDRVSGLKNVIRKLNESMVYDKDAYQLQFEKMKHYTRGKLSDDEIAEQLKYLKTRNKDKEKKIRSIEKTIRSLEAKIKGIEEGDKDEKPANRKKKRRKKKPADKAPAEGEKKAEAPEKKSTVKAKGDAPAGEKAPDAKAVETPEVTGVSEETPAKAKEKQKRNPKAEALPATEPQAAEATSESLTPAAEDEAGPAAEAAQEVKSEEPKAATEDKKPPEEPAETPD